MTTETYPHGSPLPWWENGRESKLLWALDPCRCGIHVIPPRATIDRLASGPDGRVVHLAVVRCPCGARVEWRADEAWNAASGAETAWNDIVKGLRSPQPPAAFAKVDAKIEPPPAPSLYAHIDPRELERLERVSAYATAALPALIQTMVQGLIRDHDTDFAPNVADEAFAIGYAMFEKFDDLAMTAQETEQIERESLAEDAQDIRDADRVMDAIASGDEELIPAELANRMIDGEKIRCHWSYGWRETSATLHVIPCPSCDGRTFNTYISVGQPGDPHKAVISCVACGLRATAIQKTARRAGEVAERIWNDGQGVDHGDFARAELERQRAKERHE